MKWNWELPDWPEFRWHEYALDGFERDFLLASGEFLGLYRQLDPETRTTMTVESLSDEAISTSEIEGEVLNRTSVRSSIQKQLGAAVGDSSATPAERGVAELLVAVRESYADPLTEETLLHWHRALMQGRDGMAMGAYRTHAEPMQIVSARIPHSVYFEAPPSAKVPEQISAFIQWFNSSQGMPVVSRAGVAHHYFECIHPFEDGNGRIGRAICEKALMQGVGSATCAGLSETILRHRKDYYSALERVNKTNEVTGWLVWFGGIAVEAQRRTTSFLELLLFKSRLFAALGNSLNPRQERALLRMFREGVDGFKGGLSANNYVTITGASASTATRDLSELVEWGALMRVGERRHTRYHLNVKNRAS
jgi:Fic family protein